MKNETYKIIKNFYSNEEGKTAANGISSNDCHLLCDRSYRSLRGNGLFANSYLKQSEEKTWGNDSVESSAKGAFLDYQDIVRWKSNGRIPFGDMLLDFFYAGYITKKQLLESAAIHERDNDDFWSTVEVKKSICPETGEELFNFVPQRDEDGFLVHAENCVDYNGFGDLA